MELQEAAVCRGCGKTLKGTPFYKGGDAYHPETNKRCKINQYGGYVCSKQCDINASIRMVRSMPGCSDATTPDCYAAQKIKDNWG